MELNEYQHYARSTAIYPGQGHPMGLCYVTLKLNGEAGEVAEKVGKAMRDDGYGTAVDKLNSDRRDSLIMELGDVLWYVANTAAELGMPLEAIAALNVKKLYKRKEANKLQGSGDNR